jgi:membrane fusion protein (multidrug efflux system)
VDPAPAAPKQNGRKVTGFIFAGILALAVVLAIAWYINYKKYHIATDDAYVTGRVHVIAAKVPGTVRALYVRDNQFVKKDELLLTIDDQDYEVRLRDADSALQAERSRLDEMGSRIEVARRQLTESEYRIAAAQAAVRLQETNMKQADADFKRADRLYQKAILPEEGWEKAKTNADIALAQTESAREQLRQAQAALATQQAMIRQAEAASRSQTAVIGQKEQVRKAEDLKKGYTKLVAPADGYIAKRTVEVGNQIADGQPLMAVVSLTDVWIVANYKETQLERVRPGQQVEINVDTYPGKVFRGRVDSIMAGTGSVFSLFPPENATGSYVKVVQRIPVKIVLEQGTDPDHNLRIGMSVVPTIRVER